MADSKPTGVMLYSVFGAVLGMMQFGFNTGVMNAPKEFIVNFIAANGYQSSGNVFEVINSMLPIGGMIGCAVASKVSDNCGRKKTLLINAVFGLLGAALMGFSKVFSSVGALFIGRLIIGMNCGFATSVSPNYVSELAMVQHRGAMGTLNQLAVAFGLVLSFILGIDAILGSDEGWPWLLGLAIIPSALQCMLLPLAPESPRYLLLSMRDEQQTREVLTRLRGSAEIDDEINDMYAEDRAQSQIEKFNIRDLISDRSLRSPFIIGIVMHLSQQLGGINVVFYYSSTLFQEAGLSPPIARYSLIGVGTVVFLMALVSMPLMDRLGRRTLHMAGLGGMFVFSILMTVAMLTYENNGTMSVFAVVFTLCYVAFFGVGPSSIPWMIMSELFPHAARGTAVSVGALVNWFANFVVSITFKTIRNALGEFVFMPYTVLLAVFLAFTYYRLPETKNRTIEEVTALFKQ